MSTARARSSSRSQLGLEFLEGRVVPAVVVTQLDLDGDGATDDIRIVGDIGNNAVTVQDNSTGLLSISVDANRDGDTTDAGELTNAAFNFNGNTGALEVSLGAGNDAFTYNQTGNLSGAARAMSINLGSGNNTATTTTGMNDILAGSRFDVDLTAGAGNDTINLSIGEVKASLASVRVDLGLATTMRQCHSA